ncbi:MAG: Holliday junction resolvase RuvX [Clostridia bacterium]|nr:Holliday junction resolvase RuvX [Clostridia bacterium]
MARILSIDYGDARTGLAVSDPSGFLASGIGYIKTSGLTQVAADCIKKAEELGCELILVGHPINMNGTLGPRSEKARLFADMIREKTTIEVKLIDERLTTVCAYTYMHQTGTRKKAQRQIVDTLSAEIMLQNYLDAQRKN